MKNTTSQYIQDPNNPTANIPNPDYVAPKAPVNPPKKYTQEELKGMGKTQDPVTLQVFDLPIPPVNPALSIIGADQAATPGIQTSGAIRDEETQKIADQAKKDTDAKAEVDRLRTQKEIQDLKLGIAPTTTAPIVPKSEEEYKKLQTEKDVSGFNVQDYQQKVVDLNKEKENLMAQFRKFKQVTPEGVAAGFAAGTISKEAQGVQDQIDFVNRQINTYNLQIQNRNDTINTIMGLKKEDYASASARYDKEFNQNLQVYNLIAGRAEKAATLEEKQQDNARANLQIVWNSIKTGNIDFANIPAETKNMIANLETQSKMPAGLSEFIIKNTKADIVTVSARTDDAGNEYWDILDKDLKTTTIYRGKGKVTGDTSDEKLIRDFNKRAAELIEKIDSGTASYEAGVRSLQAEFGSYGFSDKAIYAKLGEAPKKK